MPAPKPDAIALLQAEHRQVEGLFAEFEPARGGPPRHEAPTFVAVAVGEAANG